jgi:hypothetical protein
MHSIRTFLFVLIQIVLPSLCLILSVKMQVKFRGFERLYYCVQCMHKPRKGSKEVTE